MYSVSVNVFSSVVSCCKSMITLLCDVQAPINDNVVM